MQSLLVQTLVTRRGQVFLGRWRKGSGPFENRFTGLLGSVPVAPGAEPPSPEVAAAEACRKLLGPGVCIDPRRLRRRALFSFEERLSQGAAELFGPRYSEHQFVLRLRPEEGDGGPDSFDPRATETFEPAGWFGPHDIPYHMMPEDDEVWYEDVIYKDQRLRGRFVFEGTRLLEHELQTVEPFEGLCDFESQGVLLLGSSCQETTRLMEALSSRGIAWIWRDCQTAPLTLSELETLAARLQRTLGRDAVGDLFRDRRVVDEIKTENMMRNAFFKTAFGATTHDLLLEELAFRPELLNPILMKGFRAAVGTSEPDAALSLLDL